MNEKVIQRKLSLIIIVVVNRSFNSKFEYGIIKNMLNNFFSDVTNDIVSVM